MDIVQVLNEFFFSKHYLYEWLKEKYTCDIYSNDEYDILNIYIKTDYNFHETLPIEYQTLPIEYHFSDIIITNDGKYLVGISEYDPKVEYITIRIKKSKL